MFFDKKSPRFGPSRLRGNRSRLTRHNAVHRVHFIGLSSLVCGERCLLFERQGDTSEVIEEDTQKHNLLCYLPLRSRCLQIVIRVVPRSRDDYAHRGSSCSHSVTLTFPLPLLLLCCSFTQWSACRCYVSTEMLSSLFLCNSIPSVRHRHTTLCHLESFILCGTRRVW